MAAWRQSAGALGCDNAVVRQRKARFCRCRRICQEQDLRSCSSLGALHEQWGASPFEGFVSAEASSESRCSKVSSTSLASAAASLFLAASDSRPQLAAN